MFNEIKPIQLRELTPHEKACIENMAKKGERVDLVAIRHQLLINLKRGEPDKPIF